MEALAIIQALVGAGGLVSAMLAIWYLDTRHEDFEEKLAIKIAGATVVFSLMMFTPLIGTNPEFIKLGELAFPGPKVIADAITLGFLASALRDLIEKEYEDEEDTEE